MIKLSVIYQAIPPGLTFDDDYYVETQARDAASFVGKYGCRRFEIGRVITGLPFRGGRPEPYYRIMEMWFDTIEDAERCVFSPEMLALDARFRQPEHFPHVNAPAGWVSTMYTEVDTITFDGDQIASATGPNVDRIVKREA